VTYRWSYDQMKCCTLEEWFTCGKIGKEHCINKIMSDKDMSKLISEALEFIQINTQCVQRAQRGAMKR
jgi:hypothetical protein